MHQNNLNTNLEVKDLTLCYQHGHVVIDNLSAAFEENKINVIIGPNGCGKSTLLKALANVVKPSQGEVFLNAKSVREYNRKAFANTLGFLPQKNNVPAGLTVRELVARGRYVHQSFLQQWREADELALKQALQWTRLTKLAEQPLESLSGGQQQRAWIALVLAQQTPIILLDEPTTYLDIGHQHEVLNLCRWINKVHKRTCILVLHDLNQAARYADHIIAMKDGKIITTGTAKQVITRENIAELFNLTCSVITDPISNTPLIIPEFESLEDTYFE
ncbi:ABC transporter ATP-binding protein [Pseudoalteromonas sp. CO302Y]|uniref:ABC transporter ATP-binding protein n=1 Tax=unclassified Pseudoalteromonas TaxID=194690 RepID=UPI001022EC00|nr:ABC transporter ATP-binding protein [Pseudoalteromonas sp. CO302Y]RZG05940.1 ABC transporter ATP-binding protein [Pseudoalteromonas sp. CO133X]